jgi:hypothetical protein
VGIVATPCSQWIACSPAWSGRRARPLNRIVSRHRHSMPRSPIKLACLAAAVLLPTAAYGSFGGSGCSDFGCHFVTWGVLLGLVGVPISALIFAVLRAGFCHPARSKLKEFFLGGIVGAVAYEISMACGALVGASGKAPPGRDTDYLLIGFVVAYAMLAIVSVLHARSSPRHQLGGEGGDAD